ncbi:MAG: hypothetical protein WAN66_04140, partial [Limnoraphis robusta]
ASVPASRYANRDFAEPVKQKREQPDLQTILQRKTQISDRISTKVVQKQGEPTPNETELPDSSSESLMTPEKRIKTRKVELLKSKLKRELEKTLEAVKEINDQQLNEVVDQNLSKDKKEQIQKKASDIQQYIIKLQKNIADLEKNNFDNFPEITPSPVEVFKEDPESFLNNNILFPLGSNMSSRDAVNNISNLDSSRIERFTLKELKPKEYVLEPGDKNETEDKDKEQYIEAAYFPYNPGRVEENFSNVGHTRIENNTDFAFTGGMNGCAVAVTSNGDDSFEAWHFQSPGSNEEQSNEFKNRSDLKDWYPYEEYHNQKEQDKQQPQHFEASVFLYKNGSEWNILSQEIFMDVDNMTGTVVNPRRSKVNIRKLKTQTE